MDEDEVESIHNDTRPTVLLEEGFRGGGDDDESIMSGESDLNLSDTVQPSRLLDENSVKEPEDKGHLLYLTFILLGAGCVLSPSSSPLSSPYFCQASYSPIRPLWPLPTTSCSCFPAKRLSSILSSRI